MPHNPCQVDELIHGDLCNNIWICSTLSTSKGSIMAIIEELGYSKVCACSVPWMLTDECKDTRTAFTTDLCTNMTLEVRAYHCLTVIWVNHFESKSKKHLIETRQTTTQWKNKFKSVPSAGKIMVTDFWDDKSVSLVALFPRETRLNSNCCNETLGSQNACFCWDHPTRKMF